MHMSTALLQDGDLPETGPPEIGLWGDAKTTCTSEWKESVNMSYICTVEVNFDFAAFVTCSLSYHEKNQKVSSLDS